MTTTKVRATANDRLHLIVTLLVAGFFATVIVRTVMGLGVSGTPDFALLALILLAGINSLTALSRQLSWQYVLPAGLIAAVLGSVAFLSSLFSGIPLGPLMFGPPAGAMFGGRLPWTVPLLWVLVIFNSRGVARLIMRPWRKIKTYGFWLIGLTVGFSVLFDLGMDPFLARLNRYWLWQPTKLSVTWEGAPLINFLGWTFVTLLILAFATPLLIKKQPGQKSVPDYHPLVLWAGAMLFFAVVCGQHGLWVPATLDIVAVAVALVPAIRGGRW